MTRDDDPIPTARVQPKGLGEQVARAGVEAKHQARRAARIGREVAIILVGAAVVVALLGAYFAWRSQQEAAAREQELRRRLDQIERPRPPSEAELERRYRDLRDRYHDERR